ncbi:50S ribosomal protein L24e [Candidatus Micrarchaeota archaeon]|nr:50S ribosomal protein L24e [Candidatus Micrarchaeota archaeon]
MVLCSFCGREVAIGTGLTFFKRDGTAMHFCSRKCEKNQFVLKRNPAHFKWTAKFASSAKKKK